MSNIVCVVCRWIYKLPHTWTEADYDASQAKPGELAYSHMAMLTQLPNGSLASLMQVGHVYTIMSLKQCPWVLHNGILAREHQPVGKPSSP